MNNLADLIHNRMIDLGMSRADLTKRMGFANQSKGLRRLDAFLATSHDTSHLLQALPNVLGLDAANLDAAAAATRQQIVETEEAVARERFAPHILVLTRWPDVWIGTG